MNRIILCVLIVFAFSHISPAQTSETYIEKGSKAMLFELGGLAFLGANSFNGGVGGKYFINSDLAIRGGLQYTSISEDEPFQGTGGFDGKSQASQFGFSAAAEFHLSRDRVSPYAGGGLALRFISTESKTAEQNLLDQVTIKNNTAGEFGYFGGTEFMLFGMIGAEIFIIDQLSLAAEYQLGYAQLARKDEEIRQGNTTITNKQGSQTEFTLESVGVLTLAIYF